MTARRVLAVVIAVASAIFIAVQLADGWSRIGDEPLPGVASIAGAVVLLALGQFIIGEAMVVAAPSLASRAERRWAFHFTQPAKYVPGGIAHVAGVVGALVSRGVSKSAAGVLWAVHTASVIVGALAVGSLLSPSLDWPWPMVIVGIGLPLVLNRRALTLVSDRVTRSRESLRRAVELPPQRNLSACVALTAAGALLHGVAYAVLVGGGGDASRLAPVAAYCLALGVSVATPLPAGLGAREAMLLAFASAPAGDAVVPVVLVRLLLVAAEVLFWFIASIRHPSRSSAGASPDAAADDG